MSNISVKILDKDFQVACPEGQEDALMRSAKHLDQQMRQIRAGGKVIGLERIAVMAALNLSHELLQQKSSAAPNPDHSEQLKALNLRLDQTLQRFSQIEIG